MMRIVLRVELPTDWGERRQLDVENIDRPARELQADRVELSLQDGKRLLERLQQEDVRTPATRTELRFRCRGPRDRIQVRHPSLSCRSKAAALHRCCRGL